MQRPDIKTGEVLVAAVVLLAIGAVMVVAVLLSVAEKDSTVTQTPAAITPSPQSPTITMSEIAGTADTTATSTITPDSATTQLSPFPVTIPTRTSRPTRTPRPSATPTITLSPTSTDTPTVTPSSTATPSPTPTVTPTPTATLTRTHSPTPTASPTATEEQCGPPAGWVTYTVQRGETLYRISVRYRITVGELREANCLTNNTIIAGQQLWIPNVPPLYTYTPGQQTPPTQPSAADATAAVVADPCSNPIARITSPDPGQDIAGPFWVEGSANVPNFLRYEIDVRRDGSETWMHLDTYTTAVADGQLAQIDPANFGSGVFWIRLTVVDQTYNYPPRCAVRVNFQ